MVIELRQYSEALNNIIQVTAQDFLSDSAAIGDVGMVDAGQIYTAFDYKFYVRRTSVVIFHQLADVDLKGKMGVCGICGIILSVGK